MTCKLCDPQHIPGQRCAFESGAFSPDNWQCGTMGALRDAVEWKRRDDDEAASIGVLTLPLCTEEQGYLVLTWYKNRGCTGGARIVCDASPDKPLTLEIAERIAAWAETVEATEIRLARDLRDTIMAAVDGYLTEKK